MNLCGTKFYNWKKFCDTRSRFSWLPDSYVANLRIYKWKALKCQTLGAAVHVIVLVCWLESITVSWTIEAVMLARCVWFCSYLCKVCSRVSEALLLVLRTLSLSFPTNNPSSDSKAFLHFIAFSGSPTVVHCAFLSWPQSQTDLFTCTTVLHCADTFLRRIDLLHSIACTTVLHCGHTFLNLS